MDRGSRRRGIYDSSRDFEVLCNGGAVARVYPFRDPELGPIWRWVVPGDPPLRGHALTLKKALADMRRLANARVV